MDAFALTQYSQLYRLQLAPCLSTLPEGKLDETGGEGSTEQQRRGTCLGDHNENQAARRESFTPIGLSPVKPNGYLSNVQIDRPDRRTTQNLDGNLHKVWARAAL